MSNETGGPMTRQDQVERIAALLKGWRLESVTALEWRAELARWLYDAGIRLDAPAVERQKGHPTKCPKCGEEFIDLMSEVAQSLLEAPTSPGDTSSGGSTSSAAPSPSPLEAGSRTFVNGHHIPELDQERPEALPSEEVVDAVAMRLCLPSNLRERYPIAVVAENWRRLAATQQEPYRRQAAELLQATYALDHRPAAPATTPCGHCGKEVGSEDWVTVCLQCHEALLPTTEEMRGILKPTAPSTTKDDLGHYMEAAARLRDVRALVPELRAAIEDYAAARFMEGETHGGLDRVGKESRARVRALLQQIEGR